MKRHIKFPLFLKDNLPVRTMEELRSNSDIPKLLTYYADGRLAIWLRDRYEDELSEEVRALDPEQENFPAQLCKLLDIAYDGSVQSNMRDIIGRNEKIKKIRQYTNDAEILDAPECVAFTQEEFETLCWDITKEKIWLIGETFALPELKRKVLIFGVNMPKITISRESAVCFQKTDSQIQDAEYDKTIFLTIRIGDEIHFAGMDWIVLSEKAPHMLITKESVGNKSHSPSWKFTFTWLDSDIYLWLQNEFYQSKFTDKQKAEILCMYGQFCTLLSTADALKYSQYLRTPYESYMWLRDFYTFKSYAYGSLLKTQKESCDVIKEHGYNAINDLTHLHDVRPVIYVNDLGKLIKQGEATLCS